MDIVAEYDHPSLKWGAHLDFASTRRIAQYTHRIFNRYPARSISLVPRAILSALRTETRKSTSLRVLDPFMGSGTTAVESNLQGMIPYGVEIDPFARLISDVRTRRYNTVDLQRLGEQFCQLKDTWQGVQADASLLPKLNNMAHWFDEDNFAGLLQLKTAIYSVLRDYPSDLDFFRIVLADMIRPCSLAERQTLKPYISRRFKKTPTKVQDAFAKSFSVHFDALTEYSREINYHSTPIAWLGNDGTLFGPGRIRIDVAITSPPYINALDYVRCIKMESAWIDCGTDEIFAEIRQGEVGEGARISQPLAEIVRKKVCLYTDKISKGDPHRSQVIMAYFNDIYRNLQCTFNVLKPGGEYHLIVGDSVIRGVDIPTHDLIARLGEAVGFSWVQYYRYDIKDHRMSIPRNGQGGKINEEHVVSLRKV